MNIAREIGIIVRDDLDHPGLRQNLTQAINYLLVWCSIDHSCICFTTDLSYLMNSLKKTIRRDRLGGQSLSGRHAGIS